MFLRPYLGDNSRTAVCTEAHTRALGDRTHRSVPIYFILGFISGVERFLVLLNIPPDCSW